MVIKNTCIEREELNKNYPCMVMSVLISLRALGIVVDGRYTIDDGYTIGSTDRIPLSRLWCLMYSHPGVRQSSA